MKVLVTVSGGMDSTTLVHYLRNQGHEVRALGFQYGQRHDKELKHAACLMAEVKVPFEIADITYVGRLIAGKSVLLNPRMKIPKGHYEAESMKATVVPNRNMIMLSIAIGRAIALEFDAVAYGAHAGDHAIYPDCREEFAAAVSLCGLLCDWRPIKLLRPFVYMTKGQIVQLGFKLQVPLERTWSCYEGGVFHCGKCGTCNERKAAFKEAGLVDKTDYAHKTSQRSKRKTNADKTSRKATKRS